MRDDGERPPAGDLALELAGRRLIDFQLKI
jgi:hypothetical protein